LEATKDALNGDVKPVPEKKAKNIFQCHLFDSNDKNYAPTVLSL